MMYIDEETIERCLSAGDKDLAQVYATVLQTRELARLSERIEAVVAR